MEMKIMNAKTVIRILAIGSILIGLMYTVVWAFLLNVLVR